MDAPLNWTPLQVHLHTSLLSAFTKPEQLVEKCAKLGYTACAVTDYATLAGVVEFFKACTAKNIKPILGCQLYVSIIDATNHDKGNINSNLVVLAKNKAGWQSLIKIFSRSNKDDVYQDHPRLDLGRISRFTEDHNLIAITGRQGTQLANLILENKDAAIQHCQQLQNVFGKDNVFIQIEMSNNQSVLANALRLLAQDLDIKCIATNAIHYTEKEESTYQKILLCSKEQTTLSDPKIKERYPDHFETENYYLPSVEELKTWGNTDEEIENAYKVGEMCDAYNILSSVPILPKFPCPDNKTEIDYLRELCREGWKKRIDHTWDKDKYADRVKNELQTTEEANLAGYFLIVQDILNYAKSKGILCGHARGSAGGSLIAYLTRITEVDPIPPNLLFERFYNSGRKGTLPDIDMDFPPSYRQMMINYVKQKYGYDKVCQIITLGKMQGRGALKEIFRIYEVCDHITANKITSLLPSEAEIMDKLEADQETSIIRWVLKNEPKVLAEYCQILEDGTLIGDFSQYFALAIGIEGTYKSQSKHAAGIIISADPLDEVCPMIQDKSSNDAIAGLDMNSLADLGQTKFDFLGVSSLEKCMIVNRLLKYGYNKEEILV